MTSREVFKDQRTVLHRRVEVKQDLSEGLQRFDGR
jgi:hypothetical protein